MLKIISFEVYRLISPSDKSYIGLTSIGFKRRFYRHTSDWNTRIDNKCWKLCNAFNKYHPDLWKHEILFITNIKEEAEQKEIEYIKFYNSIENGYNIIPGGYYRQGHRLSEEHKKKISISHIGIKPTEEIKEKISKSKLGNTIWKGKKHSIETKLKMSISRKLYLQKRKEANLCHLDVS